MRIDKYLEIYKYLTNGKYEAKQADDITLYFFKSEPFSYLAAKENILYGFDTKHNFLTQDEVEAMIKKHSEMYQITDDNIYWGSVEWSEEDNCFYGKLLQLFREPITDLISYEGDTLEELRKDFERAVDEYSKEVCAGNK